MDHQTSKSKKQIALIDGNSFYASCERALQPALMGKPLIVLSNNDGCAIARSSEAKALGVKMGDPWFKIQHLESKGLVALSANFSLYGDLSDRMMSVLSQFSPRQEIYSIDESFLDLTGIPGNGRALGSAIRERVAQWVGIPTCVGIGTSKTLAKLANQLAKSIPRLQGICDLSALSHEALMRAIRHVPIADVWGVGRRLAPKLEALEIRTAADLAQANQRNIRDHFSVVLAKTARELAGEACLSWEEVPSPAQQIMCSRSFGHSIYDLEALSQALSLFTCRAAEKLRAQRAVTQTLHIFIKTSRSHQSIRQGENLVIPLTHPTNNTSTLTAAVLEGLAKIYRTGYPYAKAGVCLLELQPALLPKQCELDFNAPPSTDRHQPASDHVMQTLDRINTRFGRSTIQIASSFHEQNAMWLPRQKRLSPNFTTRWSDIVEVQL